MRKETIAFSLVLSLATACGTAPQVARDYVWEASELNVASEGTPWPTDQGASPTPARSRPARTPPLTVERALPAPVGITVPAAAPRIAGEPDGGGSAAAGRRPQPPAAPAAAPPPQNTSDVRAAQRVEAALSLLGTPGLADRAFVAHVLRASGQDVSVDPKIPYAAALWAKLADQRVARTGVRAGDLVFFRDTADLNGNGRPDDGVTLAGVVERARGTHVLFIAQRAGKVRRMAVDPERAQVIRDASGEVINTRLVRWPGSAEPWTTGQCLFGYARP